MSEKSDRVIALTYEYNRIERSMDKKYANDQAAWNKCYARLKAIIAEQQTIVDGI